MVAQITGNTFCNLFIWAGDETADLERGGA